MKIRQLISYGILLSMLLSSCYHNSRIVYLDNNKFNKLSPTTLVNKKEQYRLQPSDIISVQVKTTTETAASNALFNVGSMQNGFTSPGSFFLEGYTIDTKGTITIPILGEVMVKGLTIEGVQKRIQTNADKYLTKATVIVKLTSFKVTVLGEVRSPGYLYVYNSQVTVLETLGLAGDLTPFANREKVKLIRQTPAGTQVILLDLTDSNLLSSEYFFLMPNDVLYVEPLKARANRTNLEVLSVVFAGLTTTVLILSYINQE